MKNIILMQEYDYDLKVDGTDGVQNFIEMNDVFQTSTNTSYTMLTSYKVQGKNPPLIEKGNQTTVSLYDAYYGVGYRNLTNNYFTYYRSVDLARALIEYTDGTKVYANTGVKYTIKDNKISFEYTFVPLKDVKEITFYADATFQVTTQPYSLTYYLGEMFGTDIGFDVSYRQQSEEAGLLANIGAKLEIFQMNVTNKFNEVKDSITSLPQKIWEKVSDGLKSLFIPSEDYLVQFKEDLNNMLEEKLGAVYQVIDITMNSWEKIKDSDATNTINFPKVEIALLGSDKFSFGGYDVKIVPDGFDFIIESIKLIVGICASLLFINGLRKRYDEVMGVEQ